MTTIATSTAAITARVMICIISRSASWRRDQSWCAFQERRHELGRDLRDDGVTVAAQSSHSGGNPMSQRECAGFNAPRFSVEAGEPFASCTAISFDGRALRFVVRRLPAPFFQSRADRRRPPRTAVAGCAARRRSQRTDRRPRRHIPMLPGQRVLRRAIHVHPCSQPALQRSLQGGTRR